MPEELSPESKIYVKEEIENVRREFKEDLKEARNKATKTFSTVALIVGLLVSLGVYGLVKSALSATTIKTLEEQAKGLHGKIEGYEKDANTKLSQIINDANDIRSYKVVVGTIVPYGGEIEEKGLEPIEVAEGWLFCNGAPLKRKDYQKLYEVIGKAFGAPNDDTFNLPDLRGRFVRGVDHGQSRDPDVKARTASNNGGSKGDKAGSVQNDAFARHDHPLEKTVYKHWQSFQGTSGGDHTLESAPGDNRSIEWIKGTKSSGGNETRPKNIYVNWIIKAR
jgi:hypothetical protein